MSNHELRFYLNHPQQALKIMPTVYLCNAIEHAAALSLKAAVFERRLPAAGLLDALT